MNQLLSKAHIDHTKLKSILNRIRVVELIKLSDPCYCPNLRESELELIEACGLTSQDIDEFAERTWKGRPEEKFKTVSEPFRLFLVWLMLYYLKQNDIPGFESTLIYHMVRQYRNLFKKNPYFKKPCDQGAFTLALDHLSKSHLFSREGSIPNAISYLSNKLARKYEQGIRNWDIDTISEFIIASRSRLNQSFRSLAKSYNKIIKTPGQPKTVSDEEPGDQVNLPIPNRREELSRYIASRICKDGYKDQQAIDDAKKLAKISASMATTLVRELSNRTTPANYSEDVSFILELFCNGISVSEICEFRSFIKRLNRLMRVKRTTKPVYFKKEVEDLTFALVKNSGCEEEYNPLTHQTQVRVSQFLGYYITTVLRKALLEIGRTPTPFNSQKS